MKVRACLVSFAILSILPSVVAAETHQITVDGLSGQVTDNPGVVRPGDTVEVVICPADLLNYGYTIERGEVKLGMEYPIVGAGTVVDPVSVTSGVPLGVFDAEIRAERFVIVYKKLRTDIHKAIDDARGHLQTIADLQRNPQISSCDRWPDAVEKYRQGVPAEITALLARVQTLEQRRQNLATAIQDAGLANVTFPAELSTLVSQLAQPLSTLQSELNKAVATILRWQQILTRHPTPRIAQEFVMTKTSSRHTVTIKRVPVTRVAQLELPEGTEPSKAAPLTLATVTFENRAFHRFNVSLGLLGIQRDEERSFSIAPRLASDGVTSFLVQESEVDDVGVDAAGFLGIYLKPEGVDHFNPKRGRAWMLMLGTEISASPDSFFLGLGVDTPGGVVYGLGVTEYDGTSLGETWSVGQVVPVGADGKPVVATVPTSKEDQVGLYAFLGFRPAIFRAFWDRRKP